MSLSTDERPLDVNALAGDFERRASRRRNEAYGFLVLMLALLLLAAYIFANARLIADRDTAIDVDHQAEAIRSQLTADENREQRIARSMSNMEVRLSFIDQIDGVITHYQNTTGLNPKCFFTIVDDKAELLTSDVIIEKMKQALTDVGDCRAVNNKYYVVIGLLPDASLGSVSLARKLTFDLGKLNSLEKKSYNISRDYDGNFREDFDVQKTLGQKAYYEQQAVTELYKLKEKQEIDKLVGRKSDNAARLELSDIGFIIQVNIIRFGAITFIGIAIGILAPLYRFGVRLSAFYQARADALRLHQIAYKETSFVQITTALTPPMDFGKTQTVPDYLGQLLSIAGQANKGNG